MASETGDGPRDDDATRSDDAPDGATERADGARTSADDAQAPADATAGDATDGEPDDATDAADGEPDDATDAAAGEPPVWTRPAYGDPVTGHQPEFARVMATPDDLVAQAVDAGKYAATQPAAFTPDAGETDLPDVDDAGRDPAAGGATPPVAGTASVGTATAAADGTRAGDDEIDPDRIEARGGGGVPRGRRATVEIARVPSWLATAAAWAWRTLLLIVAATAVLYVMVALYLVTLPVIIALILATLCVPPARWLESHGAPRVVAATVVVIGGLGAVGGLIAALIPPFIEQAQELRPTLLLAIDQLFEFLATNFGWDRAEVMDMLDQGIAALGERGGEIAGQVLTGAALAVQSIVALTLAIVLLFFFVKDGEQITAWMIDRSPSKYEATVRAVGRRSWAALAGFVRGTAAIAMIDAIGIGVGLAIVGVPLVLPIAVLVFLGGFIPVIGAFVTGMIAVLVALVAGGFQQALIVLAIVVGVQQFESNVLQPVIMRRAVALHPIVILAALTAGAALIGIIGAFLAVPIAAVVSAAANELRLRHEAASSGFPIDREEDPIGPPDRPVATDKL